MKGIDGQEQGGHQTASPAGQPFSDDIGNWHSQHAESHRKQAQSARCEPEKLAPTAEQGVVERGMDVERGQTQHLGKRMMGEPDAIAFIPPEGLKVEARDAQKQRQQG